MFVYRHIYIVNKNHLSITVFVYNGRPLGYNDNTVAWTLMTVTYRFDCIIKILVHAI